MEENLKEQVSMEQESIEQVSKKKPNKKRKKLWITLAVIASLAAIGVGGYFFYTNRPLTVSEKAVMYADKLMCCGKDSVKIESVYKEIDEYYVTLSTEDQTEFNKSMEEYIASLPSGTKTVEQTIEALNKYYKEDLSPADKQKFIESLEKFSADLKEIERINKQKETIANFFNSFPEFFLSEEEQPIFKAKLGEYAQGIKEGKEDEVTMDGSFAQIVSYYNDLDPEMKALFVGVVEEYIK
jgi:hypothetical protein